ncbi:tryptophan 2-C-methyltransferase [Prauserella marina]|uniref:Tryptophan 2-C-methyltransferase n=1 Tax=Prauserella marina TaxID=530584 RepID=A0A222VTW0_9PSEU|nr:tryptophan 2-C-methyltransferase [Prauserella marina]ASR37367.1 tryptophan 2-C-methyltransferase [Prauserella marina]PWV74768.1 tryptophan 2-C-methyltransferase [Prauserella marina]SDD41198.1 tryptophan 2-C-methyltransferase [Prauserella marina]
MGKALVTLINPNLVHPPVTPYALDILTTSLEADDFDVDVVDLTFERHDWRSVLARYFARRSPLLVGVTVRNTDTIYAQQQRVFLGDHKEIIEAVKEGTAAPIIAGGVGFSSMPFALVDYFDIPFGVKGPGEHLVVRLANTLLDGGRPDEIPGLIVNHGDGRVERITGGRPLESRRGQRAKVDIGVVPINVTTGYTRRSGVPMKVDNLRYYREGGLGNILTKNGCTFACAHCVEPDAKGTSFTRRAVDAVVDEIESLVAQGVRDLHTTDSEFNLLVAHSKAVLSEIVRRKERDRHSPLHELRLWVYAQPTPFDEELMALLAAAGCAGINLAPDHVREEMLDDWKVTARGSRYYRFADAEAVCGMAASYGLPVMVEVLLGMPGETEETLREAVRRTLALGVTVVGYSLGIRAFPHSPLGIRLAERCAGTRTVPGLQSDTARTPIVLRPQGSVSTVEYERQFVFDETGRFRPVYYLSPELPEPESTLSSPNGRWLNTIRLLWDLVPERDRHRVMLPTVEGLTPDDDNFADNPFLVQAVRLGYTGAFWSHWPRREEVMRGIRKVELAGRRPGE